MTAANPAERHLHVTLNVIPGQGDQVRTLLAEMAPFSRSEEGNLYYVVLADVEDTNTFFIADGWATAEAHAAHHHGAETARIVSQMLPLLAGDITVRIGAPLPVE